MSLAEPLVDIHCHLDGCLRPRTLLELADAQGVKLPTRKLPALKRLLEAGKRTRNLAEYGGLRKIMPVYAGILGISMFSSLGLPGLNGFIGEFMVFKGAFPITLFWSCAATIGLVVTGVFLLSMMQKVCYGPLNEKWKDISDMTGRERFIGAVLLFFMFWLGICPAPLINASNTAVTGLINLFGK